MAAIVGSSIPEFSDHSNKLHRNLMAFSSVYLAVVVFGIQVSDAEVLGIKFGQIGEKPFHAILGAFVTYHLISYWLSAIGDISRRRWSEVHSYSLQFSENLRRITLELQRIPPIPEEDSSIWKDMKMQISETIEHLKPIPSAFDLFVCIASLRVWFEFGAATLLGAIAILTAIYNTFFLE